MIDYSFQKMEHIVGNDLHPIGCHSVPYINHEYVTNFRS